MKIRTLPAFCPSLIALCLASVPARVHAEPAKAAQAKDPKKAEAAERFDRGLRLFDEGDSTAALAEFLRAYELYPNPVVLYNLGLVYAALGRPVDALDAFERALEKPDSLAREQSERARKGLEEQKLRVGRLHVTTTPEGARIDVDNVEMAHTPLSAPLRIPAGIHTVGAVAEGYSPARKSIVIAGNVDADLHLDLVSAQSKRVANLAIQTRLPDVEVVVDGSVVGKTPLGSSLTLAPGHHSVELRRPGYVAVKRELDLGDGASGELAVDLNVDAAAVAAAGATLILSAREPEVIVFIDDAHKGPYAGPVRLPPGVHRLRVQAAGFLPFERSVSLDPTQATTVRVDLEPTPERRAALESSISMHRTWGWIGIAGGAAIAGAGAVWLGVNASSKSDTKDKYDAALAQRRGSVGVCDIMNGGSASDCNALVNTRYSDYQDAKSKDKFGYIGIGIGAAAIITGVVILVTGDDPKKYERRGTARATGERLRVEWGVGTGLGLGGEVRIAF